MSIITKLFSSASDSAFVYTARADDPDLIGTVTFSITGRLSELDL
jgi:hypothetical protein